MSSGAVALYGDVVTTGNSVITGTSLYLDAISISSANIIIGSPVDSSFTLDGGVGSVLTATAPAGRITVKADVGDLTLQGNTTFATSALLSAAGLGQSIVASFGSSTTALTTSYLQTSNLAGDGSFITLGSTWILTNGGTYANSSGDIALNGHLAFSGEDFAIISRGNIDLTGATINLAGSTEGGDLTVIAGYDFTPATDGTVLDLGTTFTNFVPSFSGGSVLGNANIITTGGFGGGGDVTIVASRSVSLGSINTSASGISGDVRIYARTGIQISGAIVTNGNENGGNVNLELCDISFPSTPSAYSITSGRATALPSPGSGTVGNIVFGAIDADTAVVELRGAFTSTNTISSSGNILSRILTVRTGEGTANLTDTSVEQFRGFGNGTVTISNDMGLFIAAVTNLKTLVLNNGSNGIMAVRGSFQNLNLTASYISADLANVSNSTLFTTIGGGNVTGTLQTNGIVTINSSGSIGTSDSIRFSTSASQISFSANNSAYISLTNSNSAKN